MLRCINICIILLYVTQFMTDCALHERTSLFSKHQLQQQDLLGGTQGPWYPHPAPPLCPPKSWTQPRSPRRGVSFQSEPVLHLEGGVGARGGLVLGRHNLSPSDSSEGGPGPHSPHAQSSPSESSEASCSGGCMPVCERLLSWAVHMHFELYDQPHS